MPQWFTGLPERSQCTIVLHHWEHDGLAVSKRSLEENPWKIPAFSELISQQLCAFTGDIFVCGYKSQAELLAGSLHDALPEKQRQHLLLMPGRSRPTIPYFGGTNGSNRYNTATAVIMLGYPRLNPREYLIHACAAYGAEQLRTEIDSIPVHEHQTRRGSVIYRLPSVQRYIQYHLASRMTQEIYRSAIRNPRFTGRLILHLFCPHQDMLEILCSQLQGTLLVRKHTELPSHFAVQKLAARHYAGGQTSFGRLVHFLEAWDGTSIQIAELREKLEISPAVWKDLMADYRIGALFDQYAVQRSGRGRCAKLMKANPNGT